MQGLPNTFQGDLASSDFAVVNLGAGSKGQLAERLVDFALCMCFGKPAILDLYASGVGASHSTTHGLNDVGGPSIAAGHPAFSEDTGLDLHTDGTLEPLGAVRTSILVCVQPAMSGGETILVRTAAVLERADEREVAHLEPLFDPRALRRHATIGGAGEFTDGPVFGRERGKVVGRYSVSPRDEWRFDQVPGLRRARDTIDALLDAAPWARFEVRLACGEALILNNTRVSHGRREFQSFDGAPRHLLRGLFRQGL
jgi:alpha-ketoglutarate-dependent taurine dioxygenase